MLSTIKRFSAPNNNQDAEGINFINQIHEIDSKRLTKIKQDLIQQYSENKNVTTVIDVLLRINVIFRKELKKFKNNKQKDMPIESNRCKSIV